ncbi:HEPN domain-containing protein [Paenibacillus etheri]|nr:HEPN domain-containing protein [Paenibacillus etheri]
MDHTKVLDMVNDLLLRVEQGYVERQIGEPYMCNGMGDGALTFRGIDNVKAFTDTVEYMWTKDREIYDTISRDRVRSELFILVRKCVDEGKLILDYIKDLFKNLKSEPIYSFEVLYHLYGAEYFKGHPLIIGPYTIYNTKTHRENLLEKYPHGKVELDDLDEISLESEVIIGVVEKTRDASRANEKALLRLRQFEDTIRFMIGDIEKRYDVGIFNFNVFKRTTGILLSDEITSSTNKMSGAIKPIHLHKFPINDPEYGHDRLWEILGKKNPTELEKRIISAIAWSGKALRDEEQARALTQYVFALEALLQFQQKGSMVSPSITYQMAEFAAFIISDDLNDRLKIEKMIKSIYGIRSAIAHGGSHEVSENVIYEVFSLLKNLITTLVKNETFKDFQTIEQVGEWVKIKKYS